MLKLESDERKNLENNYPKAFDNLYELADQFISKYEIDSVVGNGITEKSQLVRIAYALNEMYEIKDMILFGEKALLTTQLVTKGEKEFNCRFPAAIMTRTLRMLNATKRAELALKPDFANPDKSTLVSLVELADGSVYRVMFDLKGHHVDPMPEGIIRVSLCFDIDVPDEILRADLTMVE